jgi:hypothetical protein
MRLPDFGPHGLGGLVIRREEKIKLPALTDSEQAIVWKIMRRLSPGTCDRCREIFGNLKRVFQRNPPIIVLGHLKLTPTEALAILDETQSFRTDMREIIQAGTEHFRKGHSSKAHS